jgi:hypothetical protein
MTAQSSASDGHNIIHVGGITAVVVPLDEYRVLAAVKNRASAAAIEQAETDAAIAGQQAREAAGRPGGTISPEVVVAEVHGRDPAPAGYDPHAGDQHERGRTAGQGPAR